MMDTLAHALWSYIIFYRTENIWLAILFGVMPDLLSWGIYMLYTKKGFTWKKPKISLIPRWVFTLYGITHSIFVMTLAFFIVFLLFKTIPIFLYAWTVHVLIDIPTHRKDFLPTPFLWPFSNYAFPGINWANKPFMITNYALIIVFLIYINLI